MGNFWDKWGGLTQRLLASVGSQASLVALVLVFAPQPVRFEGGAKWLILFAAVLAMTSIWLEVRSEQQAHRHRKTYKREDTAGIKTYMGRWIGGSGRAAIWTRDLSWADDDAIKGLLKQKAKDGNLTVCMPKMNDIGVMLKEAGAELCIYGGKDFESPASRFTIAYLGNGGTQVAIGRTDGKFHVIEEIDATHPALHMATDLVALAMLLAKKERA